MKREAYRKDGIAAFIIGRGSKTMSHGRYSTSVETHEPTRKGTVMHACIPLLSGPSLGPVPVAALVGLIFWNLE